MRPVEAKRQEKWFAGLVRMVFLQQLDGFARSNLVRVLLIRPGEVKPAQNGAEFPLVLLRRDDAYDTVLDVAVDATRIDRPVPGQWVIEPIRTDLDRDT